MLSNTSSGGSYTNANLSLPSSTISVLEPNSEINTANDQRSLLKTLIRQIMRTFYDVPKSQIIEYIYHYECIKQEDLAKHLCLTINQVRSYIEEFKRDKIIIEEYRCEGNNVDTADNQNTKRYYYKIDIITFINVVTYRLIKMRCTVENFEQQQNCKQTKYKCEKCLKEYFEIDMGKLCKNNIQDDVICIICGGFVHEDNEINAPIMNMNLFNKQMEPLFHVLKRIDEIMINDQQNQSLLNNSCPNVTDSSTTINQDIQVVFEDDDDESFSNMDTDQTTLYIPDKPLQSSRAEFSMQPLESETKLLNIKTVHESKSLPPWFDHSTVHKDQV